MKARKRIWLIQHCQSENHISDISGGWTDIQLTDFGRKQAKKIGLKLKDQFEKSFPEIYASDLSRAKETAVIIGKEINKKPIIDKALREVNHGIGTDKNQSWIKKNSNKIPESGNGLIEYKKLDGAESIKDHYWRVAEYFNELIETNFQNMIIVSHKATISYLIGLWLGLDVDLFEKMNFVGNGGGISILDTEVSTGRRILTKFNEAIA